MNWYNAQTAYANQGINQAGFQQMANPYLIPTSHIESINPVPPKKSFLLDLRKEISDWHGDILK